MIESFSESQRVLEDAEDMFSRGARWVNRTARESNLGDGAVWIVVGRADDGRSLVLKNKENPGTTIKRTEAEQEHVPKNTVPIRPSPSGVRDGQTVGHWEYAGKEPREGE